MKKVVYRKELNAVILGAKKDITLASYDLQNKYGVTFLATRGGGNLKGKAFKLNTDKFNWVLGLDSEGATVLIPRKKSV